MSEENTVDLVAVWERLAEAVPEDPVLRGLGPHAAGSLLLMAGERGCHVTVHRGRIEAVLSGPRHLRSWHIALRSTDEGWRRFWSPHPPPGWHDLFALSRFGHMRMEGDLERLAEHLPYWQRLLALPRAWPELGGAAPEGGQRQAPHPGSESGGE